MLTSLLCLPFVGLPSWAALPQQPQPRQVQFAAPVRMQAGGEVIKVEAPGYAFPCWADVDGDGVPDLVVGQFKGGKMRVFKNLGGGRLAPGRWLEVDGNPAQIPGVW